MLKQIHEDLDREVFAAYGWPATCRTRNPGTTCVALNHERAEEERRGLVRWLRPEFQAPAEAKATQAEMAIAEPEAAVGKAGKRAWPKTLPEQVQAVRSALAIRTGVVAPAELAATSAGPGPTRFDHLGRAHRARPPRAGPRPASSWRSSGRQRGDQMQSHRLRR